MWLKDGTEVWGVEPSDAADIAGEKLHKVLRGLFDDVSSALPENYFDVVICNDVIEHMVDHDKFLETIKSKLAPDGVLVGSIPNVRFYTNLYELLINADWPYEDTGIRDRTHLRFFTQKSLLRSFHEHGYVLERFQGINDDLHRPLPTGSVKRIVKDLVKRSMLVAVLLVSFGAARDLRYLQFGFRARPE